MKLDKSAEDYMYRACITWNIPALRDADREDVDHFKRTIQLIPSAFNDTTSSAPKRMSPVRRAAEGLKAELGGDPDVAREHYEVVARRQGLPGVLGTLLIAWMSDATEKDFDRVERRLATLTGPGTRDVIARSHCKLATWAFDHGWVDQSHHHYEEARRHAGKDLRRTLDRIGHWFGRDLVFYMGQADDMTTFPWIDEWVDGAARAFVEKQLRDSAKSPWTRSWSFGNPTVEGLDIQSAGMQASWAGALWMLPQINRQHAALILAKSNDSDDVARAIALWAKGSGQDINELVSTKEAVLTERTIDDLLLNQLHEGRSVRAADTWLDICHALWAELPDRLVEDFVRNYEGPAPDMRRHSGIGVKELGLFGKLLVRSGSAVERAYSFDDWEAGLLARAFHPELLTELPPRLPARLLEAGISDVVLANEDWADTGWASLLTCWTLLDDDRVRAKHREALLEALPDSAIPTAVAIVPGLVPAARSEGRLRTTLHLLDRELRDSARGSWTGWSVHPAIDLARLAEARGHLSDSAVQRLVAIAVAPTTNSQQRRACLTALTSLAKANLVDRAQVEATFAPVTVRSVMTDDVQVDQRLEDVTRLTLMVQFGYDRAAAEGPLLAASRDSDTQIRLLAVSAVCQLSMQGLMSPSFDATLLGALYDPHPRVQAHAVPALWRGHFESHALREVARGRAVDVFPTAHRELRATIANEAGLVDSDDQFIRKLKHLAGQDRSWVVRRAVSRPGP